MLLMLSFGAKAQVSHGGSPLFNVSAMKMKANTRFMPTLDNEKLMNEDLGRSKGTPMRVSVGHRCDIDVLKDAHYSEDARGGHYLLAVQSPGATFVWLDFSTFKLADGAELFIYDQSGDVVLGSYNAGDVQDDGHFFTQSLPGSTVYIEYNVPAGADPGQLVIGNVGHGYKDIFRMIGDSYDDAAASLKGSHGNADGTCHINTICPEGDDWRDQIRAVVALEIRATAGYYSASFMCSGTLINNARGDRTPYVLSAYHCQDENELSEAFNGATITGLNFVSYFLYSTISCNQNSGSGNKSVTGATIVAKYTYNGGSDMLLLRLNSNVPDSYTPYYAGWDRTSVTNPTPGVCIHHPGGDYKKISFPRSIQRYSNFYNVSWYTGTNNKGVTEQGSSGSALFNSDKRIIGQLYAGSSACDYMQGTDLYGRFYVSWDGDYTDNSRLKNWLDPDNTGITVLDGLNYKDEDTSQVAIMGPVAGGFRQMAVYPNPTKGKISFDVDALGDANFKVFDLNGRCVLEGRTVLTATTQSISLTGLTRGTYILNLYTSSRRYSSTVIVE